MPLRALALRSDADRFRADCLACRASASDEAWPLDFIERPLLGSILKSRDSRVLGEMGEAKNHSSLFHAVANHPAAAVLTSRCQRIDRAFE
jgi:hypothetical protein